LAFGKSVDGVEIKEKTITENMQATIIRLESAPSITKW
jgi:hypothetical protein